MATSAVSGKAGVVNIGGALSEVTSWQMDRETEQLDATSMDSSGNRDFVDGLLTWRGSFTTLVFANKTGSQAAATFQVGTAAGASTPTFSGAIGIENEPVEVPVDGVVQYQYSFVGRLACTAATA